MLKKCGGSRSGGQPPLVTPRAGVAFLYPPLAVYTCIVNFVNYCRCTWWDDNFVSWKLVRINIEQNLEFNQAKEQKRITSHQSNTLCKLVCSVDIRHNRFIHMTRTHSPTSELSSLEKGIWAPSLQICWGLSENLCKLKIENRNESHTSLFPHHTHESCHMSENPQKFAPCFESTLNRDRMFNKFFHYALQKFPYG